MLDSAFAEARGYNIQQMMSYFSCEEIAIRVIFYIHLFIYKGPRLLVALSAEQRATGIVVCRLHSVFLLSTLLLYRESVDVVIVFLELSWNILLEGFSFLLIFITRRALEVSARPGRQLRAWV